MTTVPQDRSQYDDPRRLRDLLGRARDLALDHSLTCVVVGLAGFEGDSVFPEVIDFVESGLRVDDSVFRMTRERAVLLLTDVDEARASEIMDRLIEDFREHFPASTDPAISLGYFEVVPGAPDVSAKHVLPTIFSAPPTAH